MEANQEQLNKSFSEWVAEFKKLPQHAMDDQVARIFMAMSIAEMSGNLNGLDEMEQLFLCRVISTRAQTINLSISRHAVVFLSFLTRNPGAAVMYLYFLRNEQRKNNTNVSMDVITNLFPDGFPSDDELQDMWNKQKIEVGGRECNLLDFVNLDYKPAPEIIISMGFGQSN